MGDYETVGLSQTWMTAADRYGPYGWEDDKPGYDRTRVAWDAVDWSALQNQCLSRNAARLQQPAPMLPFEQRFRMRRPDEKVPAPSPEDPQAGAEAGVPRTAIVFRAWEGYNFTSEDLVNLRATITETSLRLGGEYTVHLLVDVKNTSRAIFASEANYQRAITELVPPEFWGIAVLFDETLLASWYPRVKEHSTTYQIMQPLQLFGAFYPEFAHVWQLELDLRFTGHAGRYLNALASFARAQPRKQAAERSTWFYMPAFHGAYTTLLATINATLAGGGGIAWPSSPANSTSTSTPSSSSPTPLVPHLGPLPPSPDPHDDNFTWGIHHEADLIALTPCAYLPTLTDWAWRLWNRGFPRSAQPKGWMCQPAMGRASRLLLAAVHHAQAERGLAMHSESTLSSWAVWAGLKLVVPPAPVFMDPRRAGGEMEVLYNGAGEREGGMAAGEAMRIMTLHHDVLQSVSLWWSSRFPDRIYDAWLGRKEEKGGEVPYVMWKGEDGKVWAPNMMLHPVKTNRNVPEESGWSVWVWIGIGVAVGVLGVVGGWWWWRRRRRGRGSYALLSNEDSQVFGLARLDCGSE